MAQNYGEHSYNIDGVSNEHIQWEHNPTQGNVGTCAFRGWQVEAQPREDKSYSISRTTSSRRSFRQGFLNWVAFERSLSPDVSDIVKRTCPIEGCEQRLGSEEQMRHHLKGCKLLEKGFYRCHESDRIERIGKCETNGCRALQQYKNLFSNAMHTLGRRLSRGCRPSRLVHKKKYSKSTHMFAVDPKSPFSVDWERTDSSDISPGYKSSSSTAVELSSDREDVELPAHHGSAELYAGHVTSATEYFDQSQTCIQELGVADDDSTQVRQFLAHGTYQPAELSSSTTTDFSFEYRDVNDAQNGQILGWDPTPSNYDTTPDNLLHMYCSKKDLSMAGVPTMDTHDQESPHTPDTTHPCDLAELISPVERVEWNGECPSTCIVSPMGSFTESDVNQGESPTSPSFSTTGTSVTVSCIDSIRTPPDDTTESFLSFIDIPDRISKGLIVHLETLDSTKDLLSHHSFFNEPGRVCREPISDEFHFSEAMSIPDIPPTIASPWSSKSNSIIDQTSSSSDYLRMFHENFGTQFQPQVTSKTGLPFKQPIFASPQRVQRKPVAPPVGRSNPLIQRLSPDIDYSANIGIPVSSSGKPTPYQCKYCPQRFTDKSNLKRHEKSSCKKRPNYTPDKEKRPFKCDFGICGARFTQRYNLVAHQKSQGHLVPEILPLLHQPALRIAHDSLKHQQGQDPLQHLSHTNQYINSGF